MLLINIDDQLRQLNKKDENEIKNLITINNVKYRRPYDEYIVEYPHLSSFMASVNQNDFLTDTTGSRRFLPFECISIDIQKAVTNVDIDGVWTQAYQLFKSGYRYWFTHEEITELHEANSSFQVVSIEQELLMRYFRKPQERVKATHFYTTTDIKVNLEKFSQQKLSIKKLGEALTMYNFERLKKYNKIEDNYTWIWSVIEKRGFELEKEISARELE